MTLDLTALKNYEHHLNEVGTDLGIAEFAKLDLLTKCMIAKRWQEGEDFKADRHNAEGQWT